MADAAGTREEAPATQRMKAAYADRYGPPDVVKIREATDGRPRATRSSCGCGPHRSTERTSMAIDQYLAAGLVDKLELHVVPLLLGRGKRLFAAAGADLKLDEIRVVEGPGVAHLKYRVVK